MTTTTVPRPVLSSGRPVTERQEALADGADELTGATRSRADDPRLLPTIAGATMTMGLTAILLGWFGAAHSTLLEEQIPYLISGGLLGLALATVGALLFFSNWLAISVKEARQREHARRRDHEELMAALHTLADRTGEEGSDGRARSTRAERPLRSPSSGS